jgi:hypothetical protein
MTKPYQSPVSQLLELGDASNSHHEYGTEFGITVADIPELRRLLFDETFYGVGDDEEEDYNQGWGYIHAMLALGQLKTLEALKILIEATLILNDHDGLWDSIPESMGTIGPAGLPFLAEAFRQNRRDFLKSAPFLGAMGEIGKQEPEAKAQVIQTLTDLLSEHGKNSVEMNGSLIAELIDLNAVEVSPIIERAFKAGHVDEMMAGDWDDVQIEFGLKPPREDKDTFLNRLFDSPVLPFLPTPDFDEEPESPHKDRTLARSPKQDADKTRKKKQKLEKQARKKNRKKK